MASKTKVKAKVAVAPDATHADATGAVSKKYKNLHFREAVILRPDMYMGSVCACEQALWVLKPDTAVPEMAVMHMEDIPGLRKIVDEVLVNAADHRVRIDELIATQKAAAAKPLPKSAKKPGAVAPPVADIAVHHPVKNIHVTMSATEISVRNDGDGIPVVVHDTEGCYIPEMIFTRAHAGENFDDDAPTKRVVGGRNGIGAKLTNVYSTLFRVETVDSVHQRKFVQTCTDNMSVIGEPVVTACKLKPYTCITFRPDMSRFRAPTRPDGKPGAPYTQIPPDMLAVLRTRVYEIAACAPDIKVFLDGVLVPCRGLPLFMSLFTHALHAVPGEEAAAGEDVVDVEDADAVVIEDGAAEEVATAVTATSGASAKSGASATGKRLTQAAAAEMGLIYEKGGDRWEYGVLLGDVGSLVKAAATPEAAEYVQQVSFVNSVHTYRGGTHLDYVRNQFIAGVREVVAKRHKGLDIKPAALRDMFVFFVNATVENPEFDSQSKERMHLERNKFGSTCTVSPKFIDRALKAGLEERILAFAEGRDVAAESKTDGKKKANVYVEKYDGALKAGKAESEKCTLILTEGDSAKSLAMEGLSVVGREYFGVFPLRGKVINPKDAAASRVGGRASTSTRVDDNKEVIALKAILGLTAGKDYNADNLKDLRYGRIMIMTDQDYDGSHIKGLLINLFHTKWKSLIRLGYITCMVTPLIKAYRGSERARSDIIAFYSMTDYAAWKAGPGAAPGWHIKYYKGLGTSTEAEAREYFQSPRRIRFTWDATADARIELAFAKTQADARKAWLSSYNPALVLDFGALETIPVSRFIDEELIHFSHYSVLRAIPHVIDGLKPSQRKVLWACFKRRLTGTAIKVAQLGGYVSENAAYHHGESSLEGTIVGMAQNYVYSNNINLLHPQGMFGTRMQGGKDAAQARYIYTRLSDIAPALFRPEDAPILAYTEDDGTPVEPCYYVPVIPTILVNGAHGIGTGYSCDIPPYHPLHIVAAVRRRLDARDEGTEVGDEETLTPWVDGFTGTIAAVDEEGRRFVTRGRYAVTGSNTIEVTELPIGTWTEVYKEQLVAWKKGEDSRAATFPLLDLDTDYSGSHMRFTLTVSPEFIARVETDPEWADRTLHMTSQLGTTNMVAFGPDMVPHRYTSPMEILDAFMDVRLAAYAARREYEIERLEALIPEKRAKVAYITAVCNKTITLVNKSDEEIVRLLRDMLKLPALGKGAMRAAPTKDAADDVVPEADAEEEVVADDGIGAYAYVLNLKQTAVSRRGVEALRQDVEKLEAALATARAQTPESMWRADLVTFEAAYGVFVTEKEAMMNDGRVTKAAAAPKKRAAPRKPAVTAAKPPATPAKSVAKPKAPAKTAAKPPAKSAAKPKAPAKSTAKPKAPAKSAAKPKGSKSDA